MITKERLQGIATSNNFADYSLLFAIKDIAKYLLEQAEKQEAMKPRPRGEKGEEYWYLTSCFDAKYTTDDRSSIDNRYYAAGNYFLTEQEAQAFADKIKELRKTM